MKITIEHYNQISTIEFNDDATASEVMYKFSRLLVTDGYPSSIIKENEDE